MPFENLRNQLNQQRAEIDAQEKRLEAERLATQRERERQGSLDRNAVINSTPIPRLAKELAKITQGHYFSNRYLGDPTTYHSITWGSGENGTKISVGVGINGNIYVGYQELDIESSKDGKRIVAALERAYKTDRKSTFTPDPY